MKSLIKTLVVATLGVTAFAAFAGEISGSSIDATDASSWTNSTAAYAQQEIGVTYGGGRILNSTIVARGVHNEAASRGGSSYQYIGLATGGTMNRVTVVADGAHNRSTGSGARAEQLIGAVLGGTMTNTTVIANRAMNNAQNDSARANQKIGVVN